jgi:hypothetical protein
LVSNVAFRPPGAAAGRIIRGGRLRRRRVDCGRREGIRRVGEQRNVREDSRKSLQVEV